MLNKFLENSPLHQDAVNNKDYYHRLWERAVIDEFKFLTNDEIKNKLRQTAFPFAVLFENIVGDFNLGSGIRNANAFNAKEVFYSGRKRWDKRGAVGSMCYVDITWMASIEEILELKSKYVFVGVENCEGSNSINNYSYEDNSLFIFGEEGVGMSKLMQSHCDEMIMIEQFGSVRSLNVATASGIIMNDYVTKYKRKQNEY